MSDNEEPMIQTPADFGHFLLEKELGHGGMGGVYLAHDKMLDRKVGIKVMLKSLGEDPTFVERFQREAQAAARLNHPNIAQIYSFGQEQGMPYIAMELVSGGSLDKEMERNPGTMDVVRVMRIGQQVADALATAAESGLVHGDVKPENVLFDNDGNAKLVDFGLAAMQGDSNEIWGTPYYISPEKVRRQKIDFRADMYSLGGTLYHVLTGVPPFDGADPTAVVKARFEGAPRKPSEIRPDIPPEVDDIIMRMLELEPAMRHPTYQSLLGDFKRFLSKAGPAKSIKAGGPKLKFKGVRPKLQPMPAAGTDAPADGEPVELPVDGVAAEAEEGKKRLGIGAMVGLVIGGVVLLVLLVAGGLVWYVHSTKENEAKRELAMLVGKQDEARASIAKTVGLIKEKYEDFNRKVRENEKVVKQAALDVMKVLPDDMKEEGKTVLAPIPSDAIAKAVAYTNKLLSAKSEAAPKKPEDKPAATNTVVKTTDKATAKAADKAAGGSAKSSSKTPAPTLPLAVRNYEKLWGDLCECQAADIMFHGRMTEILNAAEKANGMLEKDQATTEALGVLNNDLTDMYNKLNGEKWLTSAMRKARDMARRARSFSEEAIAKIKHTVEKRERVAEQKRKAEEKAAAEAAAEEARKQTEEAELKKVESESESLMRDIKRLEWDRCKKQLSRLGDSLTTGKGKDAVASWLRKIECMEGMQKHFAKHSKGLKFRSRPAVVTKSDEKAITLQKHRVVRGRIETGRETRVEWPRFYALKEKEYLFYMNEMINRLVVNGRESTHVSPLEWSNHMLGAALTLHYFYSEEKGVDKFIPVLVKRAVKDFEPCRAKAAEWFPEIKLEETEQ